MPDILIVSLYQAQCQQAGCTWLGAIRSDLFDASEDAEDHEAACQVNEQHADG